jgi:hypothetical protein
MESEVDLAVRHAVELARWRGASLASLTLRGAGHSPVVDGLARAALRRLGVDCAEIRFERGAGPIQLASIELQRG